jgi:NAD/NADP transhydrogenase beta subunit
LNKREIVIVNAFFLAYSGYLVAFVGFMSNSYMVLIVGALVGTSGYIFLESLKKHIKTSVLDVILGRTKPPRNISSIFSKFNQRI